ncbi:MAG TPA: hypothetical protein VGW10_06035 [Solirubrobacteraceae bacterium]|nr:hypothetical protein [Solirubrobacteraceae bacterium]
MRLRLTLAAFVAATTAAFFAPAPATAALGCPDHMSPTPAAFVNNGDKKDKEPKDGIVCAKPAPACFATQQCTGGPDFDTFGVPLLGADGNYYFVTDNSY